MIGFFINSFISSILIALTCYIICSTSSNYKLNRFILLFSLFYILLSPLISFPDLHIHSYTFEKLIPETENIEYTFNKLPNSSSAYKKINQPFRVIDIIVASYSLISIFLLARIIVNFLILFHKNKSALRFRIFGEIIYIQDEIKPYTFLNKIFISKKMYLNNSIHKEIVLHESIHKNQWHSVDIIIVELILTIFWFNPLIYLIRNLIRLNHEFLADQFVLDSGIDINHYVSLILSNHEKTNSMKYKSHFNNWQFKKRVIMMAKQKKHTDSSSVFIILGLVTILFVNTTLVSHDENIRINPADSCILEPFKGINKSGFIVNGDTTKLFVLSSEKNHHYLYEKNPLGLKHTSHNSDIAVHKFNNFILKEKNNKLYLDENYIGKIKGGDYIIVYNDARIEVYNNDRVKIKNGLDLIKLH